MPEHPADPSSGASASAVPRRLPVPPGPATGPEAAVRWVAEHLGDLGDDPTGRGPRGSERFRGGQRAADRALAGLDLTGYADRRGEVWPPSRRGATGLSPWVRHGLLDLPRLWAWAADAPTRDRDRFRDELRWQEYGRHLHARLGSATARPLRHRLAPTAGGDPWRDGAASGMACVDDALEELERDGWVPNAVRMWLASHWAVRGGVAWEAGEDLLYRQLLDGSRAANRLGWQWVAGTATGRPYAFSRGQVERRAPGRCALCPRAQDCPIEDAPDDPPLSPFAADPRLRADPDPVATAGPARVERDPDGSPDAVWLTAESLGDADPALAANPTLPAVFVFDAPLLARLRLAWPRLVFLAETLGDLAERRPIEVWRGDVVATLGGPDARPLAATFAPVPGWRRRAGSLPVVERHPWRWLDRPGSGPVSSFSAWSRAISGR